jgi:hypothetical protein
MYYNMNNKKIKNNVSSYYYSLACIINFRIILFYFLSIIIKTLGTLGQQPTPLVFI